MARAQLSVQKTSTKTSRRARSVAKRDVDAESRSTTSASSSKKKTGRNTGRKVAAATVGGRRLATPLSKLRKREAAAPQLSQSHSLQSQVPVASTASTLANLKAIVINLERREDRMLGCQARLDANCQWLQYSRFIASDGRKNPIAESDCTLSWDTTSNVVYQKKRAIRKGWNDLDTYQERRLALSPGERGCASSHIRAWQHCVEHAAVDRKEQPLLVLEDDAAPTAEFTEILSRALAHLPADAGVLYLGYSQAAEWRRSISPELAEAEYVWTTVAYIIWPHAARKLLSRLPVDQPVDNWMAALCAKGDIKSYCVRPKIVHQADAWNVNSDVGHSDEHYWGPCSDIAHSDEFYWGAEPEHDGDFLLADGATGEALPGSSKFGAGSLLWGNESDDSADESMD